MITPIDDPLMIYEIVCESIGNAFSLRELVKVIEKVFVERPIHIQRIPLPPHRTGRIYNLLDSVVIQINENLDRDHAQVVCCHELAHVIFGHARVRNLHYSEFLKALQQGQLDDILALYREPTVFDAPQEQAAEDLAVLLIECIERWESTLPSLAQDIYGD